MFSKLLKYDLRATARIIPFSYLALAVLYIVAFAIRFTVGYDNLVAYALPILVFAAADVAMLILTVVLVIAHYHRTMFGQTAYFTHTVPASKSLIFFSKFLTSFIWLLLSIVLFFAGLLGVVTLASANPGETLNSCMDLVKMIPASLTALFGVIVAAQFVLFISAVTGCITLANVVPFAKNNIAFSFVFYIVFSVIQNIIDTVALLFIPLGFSYSLTDGTKFIFESMITYWSPNASIQMGLGSAVVDILMIVAIIVLNIQLLKKRVSIR